VADGYAINEGKEILEEHWKEVFYEWALRNKENKNRDNTRSVPLETTTSNALISCDGLGNFMPPKHDLSFSGLEEFMNEPIVSEPIVKKPVVETSEAKDSEAKSKAVMKNNGAPIIKDWVSDSKEEDVPQAKIEKKTVKPSFAKIKFVKSKEQRVNTVSDKNVNTSRPKVVVNAARPKAIPNAVKGNQGNPQMDLQDQGVIDSGYSRHMTRNMSYLTDFEEIDEGYVAFGGLIRCDSGTEFKNKEMNQFCERKGIKREFSIVRTPQQNRAAERKNKTLIETARTMLADSKLLTTFLAEAVNIACYVQNMVIVTKPYNKTPYELFLGRKPALGFMRPFGYLVTILNTIDHLGKFDGKADEGFFVGYLINRSGPNWLFDIDALTNSMNYKPVIVGNQSNSNADTKACDDASKATMETVPGKDYML
ncbi:ribonuclease H-like domain-containing protein, partial [Tanacetum coccineum]